MDARFDYSKLRGKIKEVFGTQKSFCNAMRMNGATLSAKLGNKTPFSQDEILKARRLLGLGAIDIPDYFFSEQS